MSCSAIWHGNNTAINILKLSKLDNVIILLAVLLPNTTTTQLSYYLFINKVYPTVLSIDCFHLISASYSFAKFEKPRKV